MSDWLVALIYVLGFAQGLWLGHVLNAAGVLRTCLERLRGMTTKPYESGRQAPQCSSDSLSVRGRANTDPVAGRVKPDEGEPAKPEDKDADLRSAVCITPDRLSVSNNRQFWTFGRRRKLIRFLRFIDVWPRPARPEDFISINSRGASFDIAGWWSTPQGRRHLQRQCDKLDL